jgi:hypothetical protein
MFRHSRPDRGLRGSPPQHRRGAFLVMAFFCLVAMLGFVAFSIDTGHVALNKTLMQNAVDAAALAAAMEITHAVENAPPGETDPTAYARDQARLMARDTAALNGVFVDPNLDVQFGLRSFDPGTEEFTIEWGVEPANAVKVVARRDNPDTTQPDGKVPHIFAGVLGSDSVTMRAEAIGYIEARDIAVVLDFSGSMAYDSLFRSDSVSRLGVDAITENLENAYIEMDLDEEEVGTLDRVDPDDVDSAFTVDSKWLIVHSPPSGNPRDPDVDVTFMHTSAFVEADRAFQEVELDFTDGTSEAFTHPAVSGTFAGTGSNAGKNIDTVWVMFAGGDVMVSGADGSGCRPHIDVTFHAEGTSVYVVSTKDLSNVVLEFADGVKYKFNNLNQGKTGTFQGIGANAGKQIVGVWVKSGCNASGDGPGYGERFDSPITGWTSIAIEFNDSNDNVKGYFQLDDDEFPFSAGSWDGYVNYVRSDTEINRGGLREKYGPVSLAHYALEVLPKHSQCPQLAKTSHFPFHAVRAGNELFADFLQDLGFGDHIGLVSYDQYKRVEQALSEDGHSIDISADPLDENYEQVKTIMQYKQAGHYYARTNIGGGLRQAQQLIEDHGRTGARPTILLMTDGNANVYENTGGQNHLQSGYAADSYWELPSDFDWTIFEYPDGTSFHLDPPSSGGTSAWENYKAACYTLKMAKQAADDGITVHTLCVGAGADRDLMKAVAWLGGGEYISVEGDLSVEDLLQEVEAGFYRIAALVPPARLANPDEEN